MRMCLLILIALPNALMAQTVPATVQLSGQSSPWGSTITAFSSYPAINNAGMVYVHAGTTTVSGFQVGPVGGLAAAAVQLTSASGGGTYGGGDGIARFNNVGDITFFSSMSDGKRAIFFGHPGAIQQIAREGQTSPAGGTYGQFVRAPFISHGGQVAFHVALNGASGTSGLFAGTPGGAIQTVASQGGPAPNGGNYSSISTRPSIASTPAGMQVAFLTSLSGGTASQGIFSGLPGALQRVALNGLTAPGGDTYTTLQDPVINSHGTVAFRASLSGIPGNEGIFIGTPGAVNAVARRAQAAPGGGTFTGFSSPVLNSVNQVVFQGYLTGTFFASGLYRGNHQIGLVPLMHTGEMAPGTSDGIEISTFSGYSTNIKGQVAVSVVLAGPAVTTSNDVAIYAGDESGMRLIAREGDLYDVDAGPSVDLRTVSVATIVAESGGEEGRHSVLNDHGTLIYRLSFTDGTHGVFTTTLVSEPTWMLLCGLMVVARSKLGSATA